MAGGRRAGPSRELHFRQTVPRLEWSYEVKFPDHGTAGGKVVAAGWRPPSTNQRP